MREILSSNWFIHLNVFLGFIAIWGYIELQRYSKFNYKYLIICIALAFSGAFCGSLIKIIDLINSKL